MAEKTAAVEYHAKDFEWDELRKEVEKDSSLSYHLAPPPARGHYHHDSSSVSSAWSDCDAWRRFHRRHSTGKFFKERRYLLKEFPELATHGDRPCKVLEVGCGNGSTALPVLRMQLLHMGNEDIPHTYDSYLTKNSCSVMKLLGHTTQNLKMTSGYDVHYFSAGEDVVVYACDCSADALERAKEMVETADFNIDSPSLEVQCCIGGVDYITLVFTLSAVPFEKMAFILSECISVLKPGGFLFFRDYGLYDMTMLRFPPKQRVGLHEYMRVDGTFSYFFSLDVARRLFLSAGFIELELEYCCIRSVNRRSGKHMHRVWVHGKFQKPT